MGYTSRLVGGLTVNKKRFHVINTEVVMSGGAAATGGVGGAGVRPTMHIETQKLHKVNERKQGVVGGRP